MSVSMSRFKFAATAALAAGAIGGSALAQTSKPDQSFIEEAATGGMAEVELGRLAQQQASSDAVKQFGARMAEDHAKANDELKQVAAAKGVSLPSAPTRSQQTDKEHLQKLSGSQFDKQYMDHMVSDHRKDIAAFEREASSGTDSDVKSFAAKTLPTLREHLKLAVQARQAVSQTASPVKNAASASR